jgi:esterase/lipase superfamily enzyme
MIRLKENDAGHILSIFLETILVVAIGGCQTQLMPTPNLYLNKPQEFSTAVPPIYRDSKVDIIYATDRKPEYQKDGKLAYGFGRSASMAYGSCEVEIGKNVSWDILVKNSCTSKRMVSLPLTVLTIREKNRFPETPLSLAAEGENIVIDPASLAEENKIAEQFQREIARRLQMTPRKEAYIFVHGNFASFDDAMFMFAGLWHFMGRQGVPIVYSWPAGSPGGMLRRYTYDTTSGAFTVYHLKQFLRWVAATPNLEKIHILSHSQGTNVICNAIRELIIEARAAGQDPQTRLKIGNLVLAAPDIDYDVALQRMATERFYTAMYRVTIYTSQHDKMLGAADWLFRQERVGQVKVADFSPALRSRGGLIRRVDVIDANVKADPDGHYYFYASSAVSSDLILLLRDNRDPGRQNGRPLIPVAQNYWKITDDYLVHDADSNKSEQVKN